MRTMSGYKNTALLKSDARASLLGHLSTSVCSIAVYYISVFTLSALISVMQAINPILSLILSSITFLVLDICSGMLEIGLCMQFLRYQDGKNALVGDLFTAFRFNSNTCISVQFALALMDLCFLLPAFILSVMPAGEGSAVMIAFFVLTGLGMCLLFFRRLVFAMTPFMLLDFPQLTDRQILRAGYKMMKGHKARLFRLYLSFIPLMLVGIISFGTANLWINSYIHAATAAFYKDRVSHL